jgi:hypothetical protein
MTAPVPEIMDTSSCITCQHKCTLRINYGLVYYWIAKWFWMLINFNVIFCGGVTLSPLGMSATIWPIVPPRDDGWWVWGSRWNENWLGKWKCSYAPQIPNDLTWCRTWAAAVGSRLAACKSRCRLVRSTIYTAHRFQCSCSCRDPCCNSVFYAFCGQLQKWHWKGGHGTEPTDRIASAVSLMRSLLPTVLKPNRAWGPVIRPFNKAIIVITTTP